MKFAIAILVVLMAAHCSAFTYDELIQQLAAAQVQSDLAQVLSITSSIKSLLGDTAGVPDAPPTLHTVPTGVPPVSPAELQVAFDPYLSAIAAGRWWYVGSSPSPSHLLREPASVIVGCVFAERAGCNHKSLLRSTARDAADYLLWAQQQAGSGGFPYPAVAGYPSHNGWTTDDVGEGGLQYDNGLCGVAVLEQYRLTRNGKYLQAAQQAGDWAITRPCVPNWNYNSFSVYLLAELGREHGGKCYRNAAIQKAKLGVFPGELTGDVRPGRWYDPHNARIEYHFVIVRSLVSLALDRKSLQLALQARDSEFTNGQIPNVSSALEALVLLQTYYPNSESILGDCQQQPALDAIGAYCVDGVRKGGLPVDPGPWGRYLFYLKLK